MYILSEKLQERIREISREAARQSGGAIDFEEYVAVPHYGQIVLRYMLNLESFTLEDLDRYENLLNETSGGDFLCDFMGSVYQKAGIDYSGIWQRLAEMNDRFANEEIIPSIHADGIREDAVFLLKTAGLNPESPVWEIQSEGDECSFNGGRNGQPGLLRTDERYIPLPSEPYFPGQDPGRGITGNKN